MNAHHTHSARPRLPQSVLGQIRLLLFQPDTFFKALMFQRSAWVLMAVLLMLLTGVSEVQRQQRLNAPADDGFAVPVDMPPMGDMGMGDPIMSDPMMGGGGVPLPPMDGGGAGGDGDSGVPITEQIEQILGAGGAVLALWGLLVPLLLLIPLFNGRAPRFSHALQVTIWATLPLGLLALLQLVYYNAGGQAGEPGLAGLMDELPFYASLSGLQQQIVLSATSRVTLFHGWMILLVYVGARHTLRGKRFVIIPILFAWLALIVLLPVALQPAPETAPDVISDEMPADEMPADDLFDPMGPIDENADTLPDDLANPMTTPEASADPFSATAEAENILDDVADELPADDSVSEADAPQATATPVSKPSQRPVR